MMALRASSAECISNWDEASVGSGDILSVFGQTGGCLGADVCFFAEHDAYGFLLILVCSRRSGRKARGNRRCVSKSKLFSGESEAIRHN